MRAYEPDTAETDSLLGSSSRPPRARLAPTDRSRWLALGGAWALSVVVTAAITARTRPAPPRPPPDFGPFNDTAPPPLVGYPTWPRPQTNRSAETQRAIGFGGFGPPPRVDAARIGAALLELGRVRAARGEDPPILVLAGGHSPLGLGNIFSGLAAAAVTAEALGAACLVSLGASYAKALTTHLHASRAFAYPCQLISLDEIEALRIQKVVPVVSHVRWRVRGMAGVRARGAAGDGARPALGGAYVLDFGIKYRELACLPRADAAKLLTPPGMGPAQFWPRLRSKFEQWLHASITLPLELHERAIDAPKRPWGPAAGTLCGHLRLLHVESARGSRRAARRGAGAGGGAPRPDCSRKECGSVLGAMEALHRARPFASFFLSSGADCAHCLAECAPTLARDASRITSGHTSRHIQYDAAFDDALGALADMRALSRCALVVVDDKAEGTYALSLAASGRLTPCADPLAVVETWQPGFGHVARAIRNGVNVGGGRNAFNTRALCASAEPRAPVTPPPWPWGDAGDARAAELRDAVRFDLSRVWDPVLLPAPGARARLVAGAHLPEKCEFVLAPRPRLK